MDIVLGTVQFGLDYGVSNNSGKISNRNVSDILSTAWNGGISTIDTAIDYGNSEELIGRMSGGYEWNIITKTPGIDSNYISKDYLKLVDKSLKQSMNYLGVKQLEGVLVHSCDDLFKPGGEELFALINDLKNNGKTRKIGVSVYDYKQIDKILDNFGVDIIQLPLSIMDQRLIKSKHLEKIKKYGIEVHARSIFLQGLLLMNLDDVPMYFSKVYGSLRDFKISAREMLMSDIEFAINFVRNVKHVDKMIIGVNTVEQLNEIIKTPNIKLKSSKFCDIAVHDDNYVNPSNWNL